MTYSNSIDRNTSSEEIKEKVIENLVSSATVSDSESPFNFKDDSIIDVTPVTNHKVIENIQSNNILPYHWNNIIIQSYDDIYCATLEQNDFYFTFKRAFLRNIFIDLKGYTNYLYILYFDLIKEYEIGKDINKLEGLMKRLVSFYPVMKDYVDSEFSIIIANNTNFLDTNILYNTDYDYWKLGSKFKSILKLKEEEVKLLNKIWYPNNNFCSIEFCCIEISKLYISTINDLKTSYITEGTTIDIQFLDLADIIARKQHKYRKGSQNYKYCLESTNNQLYTHIFKLCENAVREYFGHKRKINIETYYSTEVKFEFETKIVTKVLSILSRQISNVSLPDEATDIELYSQNTNRWKIKYSEIIANFNNNSKEFVENIIILGALNKRNPSVENIFYESSKFIAKYDKESALILYVNYLYYDLKSPTFDNKQLTKTIQKSLFKTNEQLHDFEKIVSELVIDKDLEKALNNVLKIYEIKRKKIKLDTATIREVQQQHSGTVELLNEYLKDDFKDEYNSIKSQEISNEEIRIEITQKSDNSHSPFISDLSFSPIQMSVLELFFKSNFSVPQSEFEVFAKSKGAFKNQLIESINDTCFDFLDDVLIEEEDDYYTININYFHRISVQ